MEFLLFSIETSQISPLFIIVIIGNQINVIMFEKSFYILDSYSFIF